ncbi:MAG: NFACT RNA binding domain-containing protein [Candidatus Diapherotrites archaeon]|nr:NFACT RNA binding domain-containing protein [Candidatus Diapherotrites archaeon]
MSTKIELFFDKSLEENANYYFEQSKKLKKKLEGLEKALKEMEQKLEDAKKNVVEKKEIKLEKKRRREWFEKFRWFFTSNGFLVIAGRDATSNEVVVKKYMEKDDLYFHADVYGAPHVVLKTCKSEIKQEDKEEAATFAATFSNAWKDGISYANVYSVKPEQVTKEAPTGEFLTRGAFYIKGQREWFYKVKLECFIGIEKFEDSYRVMAGPKKAVEKKCFVFFEIKQGKKEKSEVAKIIKNYVKEKYGIDLNLDDLIAAMPNGYSDVIIK